MREKGDRGLEDQDEEVATTQDLGTFRSGAATLLASA